MSLCAGVIENNIVVNSACEYILLTKKELIDLAAQPSLAELIEFDPALYELLLVSMLVSFVVGHMTGRIIKMFGKV